MADLERPLVPHITFVYPDFFARQKPHLHDRMADAPVDHQRYNVWVKETEIQATILQHLQLKKGAPPEGNGGAFKTARGPLDPLRTLAHQIFSDA